MVSGKGYGREEKEEGKERKRKMLAWQPRIMYLVRWSQYLPLEAMERKRRR